MVGASVLLLLGFIISIIKKCSRFSEHGHKVIAGILTSLLILGGKTFQSLFTVGIGFYCYKSLFVISVPLIMKEVQNDKYDVILVGRA